MERGPSKSRQWLSGDNRRELGAITSWETADGRSLVLHRKGATKEWLPALCDEVVALEPSFRLAAYSTIDTIRTDLEGSRATTQIGRFVQLPERYALALVRRPELLHPRLGGPPW